MLTRYACYLIGLESSQDGAHYLSMMPRAIMTMTMMMSMVSKAFAELRGLVLVHINLAAAIDANKNPKNVTMVPATK